MPQTSLFYLVTLKCSTRIPKVNAYGLAVSLHLTTDSTVTELMTNKALSSVWFSVVPDRHDNRPS